MFEIGNSLFEARMRREINLVEAEQDTKIRSKYLAALEAEEFDVLPGSVYARGFLRTYANYLGLDPQLYIDEYNARFGRFEEVDDAPARSRPLHLERRRRGLLSLRTLAIASLLVLAGLTWLGLRSSPAPVTSDEPLVDVSPAVVDTTTLSQQYGATDDRRQARQPGAGKPAASARVAQLVLTGRDASSWVEVRRASATGKLLWAGTLEGGDRRTFRGARLFVTVGYPPAVTLQLAGRQQRVRRTQVETARFVVTPTRIAPAA